MNKIYVKANYDLFLNNGIVKKNEVIEIEKSEVLGKLIRQECLIEVEKPFKPETPIFLNKADAKKQDKEKTLKDKLFTKWI